MIFSLCLLAALVIQAPLALANNMSVPFFNPTPGGGSMLDLAVPVPLGEPLNVIISGLSSPPVLTDSGFLNYVRSFGFSSECLGIHSGTPFTANLGDGNGSVNQTAELRQDYGNPTIGTCIETLIGGDHMRVYRQNGSLANSGALFLATSKELDLSKGHTIASDGYNAGRDEIVAWASGTTTFNGVRYSTTVENITGLLAPGSAGINHNISQDGMVALLTVSILSP